MVPPFLGGFFLPLDSYGILNIEISSFWGILMKKIALFLILAMLLSGCQAAPAAQVAATTLPVYEFTSRLCQGAGITVARLVTEPVSCLHDYSLGVAQLRTLEGAELVVISGAGLEDFLPLEAADKVLDASRGIELLPGPDGEPDPHIWLSPACARQMAQNICDGLCVRYPAQKSVFRDNLASLLSDLTALEDYGREALAPLAQKGLLPFHDGFSYFARDFGLNVLASIEEESGSEAPAALLIQLSGIVEAENLPAIFVEMNGSDAAAGIISRETGVPIFSLDMAMAGDSYFDALYRDIDTIREAYT